MKNTKISEDVYEKLADALEALPAGFTRTPSKSEINSSRWCLPRGSLGCQSTDRKPETADEIAERVGLRRG